MKGLVNLFQNKLKLYLLLGGVVLVTIIVFILVIRLKSKDGEFSVISESSLKEVLEVEELSTLEYFYNSIATQTLEESDTIKYYVRYEGIVKLGIEFDEISINLEEQDKKITITLPEVKIMDCVVEQSTMDFIFTKDKYETENVLVEAYELCSNDLEKKVAESSSLFKMAKENAVTSIEALLFPWIEQLDKEYVVTVE